MGKASRAKRERRDQEQAGGGSSLPRIDVASAPRRPFPVFWTVIALMVVAGLAALVLTAPDDATKEREAAASDAPTYADVQVDGELLASWSGSGSDRAEGEQVPTISGTNMDDEAMVVQPGGGVARAYVVMAHWCPNCQAEIPKIAEWAQSNELPAGVEVVGISTAVDDGQANFPPATWLAREDWPYETMVDDELGTAAEALGTSGYPFMVFTDADGEVVSRHSGQMDDGDWEDAIQSIAPADAAPADAA